METAIRTEGLPDMKIFIAAVTVVIFTYLLMRIFSSGQRDSREPPSVPSKIPFVGHILGLMRYKMSYYVKLRTMYPFPIYSLALLGKQMYIINSPELIVSVQRNWKTLQFAPFASRFTTRISRLNPQTTRILMDNVSLEKGDWGLYSESLKGMHAALAPGGGLERMSRTMIQNVTASLDSLQTGNETVRLKLASWLRHEITLATSEAVYGPGNPLRDPKVEDGFWAFENDLTMLLINILPAVTARKGYQGRAICFEAFKQYFASKDPEDGSELVKARMKASQKYSIPVDEIARFEVGGILAILDNSVPAAFWMLFYVFSSPSITIDLRLELEKILETRTDEKGVILRTLNVPSMKGKCPLLVSTFQETLRHRSCGVSTREVLQDVLLNDEFLLKAGSIIQIPSRVIHTDPAIWGTTVEEFDPRRFIKKRDKEARDQRVDPAAFRAFGGGTTLCPGRHFASTEVMCVVAMFVMRYELRPVSGEWRMPPPKDDNIAASVMFPGLDTEVDVRPRKGYEDGLWAFQLDEPRS